MEEAQVSPVIVLIDILVTVLAIKAPVITRIILLPTLIVTCSTFVEHQKHINGTVMLIVMIQLRTWQQHTAV